MSPTASPKIVTLDIETSPNLAHVWGLWNQNVSLSQLMESGEVIAFAAKYYGERKVEFYSNFHDTHQTMVQHAHRILTDADIVVHYNGTKFDLPHLRGAIVLGGLNPPSPVQEIDLLRVVRANFRFPSNKLEYVGTALGLGGKVKHMGHELWVRCLAGDEKAWALMKRYNIGDVKLTERLYDKLKAWLPKGYPHLGLFNLDGEDHCPRCNSTQLVKEGLAYTPTRTYQRFSCKHCGSWSRSSRSIEGVAVQGIN